MAALAFYFTAGLAGTLAGAIASCLVDGVTAKRWAWVIGGVTVAILLALLELSAGVVDALAAPRAEPVQHPREDS